MKEIRQSENDPRIRNNVEKDSKVTRDIVRDGLLGLAVGDAFGVPVEFLDRKTVQEIHLSEMVGLEDRLPFDSRWGNLIPAGAWSDDTSMTIAAIDALVKDKGEINYDHIMDSFISWWYGGKYTSIEVPFGLGGVISKSLENYLKGIPAMKCGGTHFHENGNGSLMRILPFALICIGRDMSEAETVEYLGKASSVTHAHEISKMACFIYTELLRNLLVTGNPGSAHSAICSIDYSKYYSEEAIREYAKLLSSDFPRIDACEISEKNGYVAATLESAVFAILNTDSFETAIEQAVNFGYDTDTIGAVTGSLAGILYGYDSIPERWLLKLKKREELKRIAASFSRVI